MGSGRDCLRRNFKGQSLNAARSYEILDSAWESTHPKAEIVQGVTANADCSAQPTVTMILTAHIIARPYHPSAPLDFRPAA